MEGEGFGFESTDKQECGGAGITRVICGEHHVPRSGRRLQVVILQSSTTVQAGP